MTYCTALCLNEGLVFLSDTRTNAGVDQVGTFRKMAIFQRKNDRLFVLMSAGNLAITQAVKELLHQSHKFNGFNLWNTKSTYEAATVVSEAVRVVKEQHEKALERSNIEFNCNLIFGGQVRGEKPRLFNIYSAGNFIETTPETCYLQIGESKYGKPILDRVVNFQTPLNIGTKCALKSNISVGLPLDLLVYEKDSFSADKLVTIDEGNQYFSMIHDYWGKKLKQVFMEIEEPIWNNEEDDLSIVSKKTKLSPIGIIRDTW